MIDLVYLANIEFVSVIKIKRDEFNNIVFLLSNADLSRSSWQTTDFLFRRRSVRGQQFLDITAKEEAVADLSTILDMLRWAMSQFNSSDIYYGHGTDNAWDEALQLVLPTLALPFRYS